MITKKSRKLSIALGANLPSQAGSPASTLIEARPKLESIICNWVHSLNEKKSGTETLSKELRWRWSPLYETNPVGGPSTQPMYINAVLVVDGWVLESIKPSELAAMNLLERFLKLEEQFGRNRDATKITWGPRTLDIDLLAWGNLNTQRKGLVLPHPRMLERNFVIVPLGEALNIGSNKPRRISPQLKWPE